jgi:hypothetical protein
MSVPNPRVAIVLLVAGLVGSATADAQTTPNDRANLPGVWELVSIEDHWANGEVTYWLGEHPTGKILYTPQGRMAVQFMADPRPTFAGGTLASASAEEVRRAFDGYYAYFGTYDVDESQRTLTHHVVSSMRPREVGISLVRSYELAEDRLVLRVRGSVEGREYTRVLVFERGERL